MASVIQIVERARRRLGVQAAEEPVTAQEAVEGREALNDMLQGWKLDRLIAGAPTLGANTDLVTVETSGSGTLSDEANEAIVTCLAVRLADNYGMQPSPALVSLCNQGKAALQRAGLAIDDLAARQDIALLTMPSQRRWWGR